MNHKTFLCIFQSSEWESRDFGKVELTAMKACFLATMYRKSNYEGKVRTVNSFKIDQYKIIKVR